MHAHGEDWDEDDGTQFVCITHHMYLVPGLSHLSFYHMRCSYAGMLSKAPRQHHIKASYITCQYCPGKQIQFAFCMRCIEFYRCPDVREQGFGALLM